MTEMYLYPSSMDNNVHRNMEFLHFAVWSRVSFLVSQLGSGTLDNNAVIAAKLPSTSTFRSLSLSTFPVDGTVL